MLISIILKIVLVASTCYAYDPIDLEIYDLVEEVGLNQTFYQLLDVEQDSTTAVIRKAYRKLSLLHHPDKSKEADAEAKFRNIVAVYEILKDADKRKKYDQVLKDGLPDWRQPIYYYRKARKMGLRETLILVFLIATVGHYLFKWAAFLEKKFEIEELISPLKKRKEKKRAKGKSDDYGDLDDTDSILEKEFGYRRPQFLDLLPFAIYFGCVGFIRSIPERYREGIKMVKDYQEQQKQKKEEEEEENIAVQQPAKPKIKKKPPTVVLRDASEYEEAEKSRVLNAAEIARISQAAASDTDNQKYKDGEWNEQDLSALIKAIAKFPGGTPGRWEKIAHEIGRPVHEVTKRMKEMKENIAASNNVAGQLSASSDVTFKKRAVNFSDNVVIKLIDRKVNKTIAPDNFYMSQDDIPDDYDQGTEYVEDDFDKEQYQNLRKRKVKRKGVPFDGILENENNEKESVTGEKNDSSTENITNQQSQSDLGADEFGGVWSQSQQKCLEAALSQFPKSVPDRWTCIARAVPGKNKDECLGRYKMLVDHIKKKRNTASAT